MLLLLLLLLLYSVGYCKPQHLHENLENIGAYLEGEREKNSLYELQIGVEKTCSVLCAKVCILVHVKTESLQPPSK